MTIPSSVVIGVLVLAWLIVLVPMVARRHEPVHETEEGANFRVLRTNSGKSRNKLGRRTADSDQLELTDDVSDDRIETAEVVVETEEIEVQAMSEDTVVLERIVVETVRIETVVADDQQVDDEQVDDEQVADEVVAPVRERHVVRGSAEEDHEADDYNGFEHARTRHVTRPSVAVDEHDDDRAEPQYVPARAARYQPERPSGPRPVRHGRGGFDPEAADMARAYRYAQRQRVALTLLLLTLATAGAAVFTLPVVWSATAVFGLMLVTYLWYLRRQVTIEEDIRHRRLARLQRAREIRPEYDGGTYEPVDERVSDAPAAVTATVAAPHRRGRVVLDLDDDDPGFEDLEYYAPVEYRRASGQ